ncbi:putative transmembrane anti-sigma factor [Paenibacillus curdlanolyticus YK9]|uniref:Anti-sigma-W factor RsiW n=1 Tax=Paenibacillus curdlanolyticus YK9 TaxID=717606 RepID=E0I8D8_9BACL|nr:zf-HC2 domain-containing protein [Paenibacillus curdlanolyticus]EFM11443.1 putative transmembrane anti-sigma factor [Paenibacillus curdlanolyticus YK9]
MNCNVATVWMHDYLDGELPQQDVRELKAHLLECPSCRMKFEQLDRTESLLSSAMHARGSIEPEQSARLNERIMAALPKRRRQSPWISWVRNHPAATVAALFLFVMLSSFLSMWHQGGELIVRGQDLQSVVIQGDKVIVPAGTKVHGDLTIENGIAEVQGDVDGNVTVIDGSLQLASTAHIAGSSRTIDRALDWFWYKVTETVTDIAK